MSRFERIRILTVLYCAVAVAVAAVSTVLGVLLLLPPLLALLILGAVRWVLGGDAGHHAR